MTPILLTTTNEKQPDSVVAWDPLGGSPVVAFSGEPAHRESLTTFNGGVVCAAVKKPFIQVWNFQTATTVYKRILTKGPVSVIKFTPDNEYMFTALERDVYVYQTSSGCLVAVLDGCHSAKIGQIKLSSSCFSTPPLLVTADVSGFLATWSLDRLMDNPSLMTTIETFPSGVNGLNFTTPDTKNTPLWYLIQASQGLPCIEFMQQNLLVAGSEGLKMLDALDGTVISVALTSVVGGLHSLCPLPVIDGRIISGGTEGLLYTCSLDHTKRSLVPNKEIRRCFVSSKLQTAQKTIVALVLSPGDHNLLIAGCRGGTVEVLRTDSLLTTLQQFSVLNPTIAGEISNPHQLTGMCMASRPDWLSSLEAPHQLNNSEQPKFNTEDSSASSNKTFCLIEPLKHHFGWHLDDLVRIRLPSTNERSDLSHHRADIYMDDFYEVASGIVEDEPDPGEVKQLRAEIDKLTGINRNLLRRLVDNELRS
ncbi:hypothetical protein CRM22_002905 [Opisthorchis felineus]|uniref:WD repeat-containing protein 18 n=1 Tax=Opisthorchis felineus TaxID=147828 RepID=A0A4S2M3Q1_OPIFE|nr:hypothetical protein CRM22_002905 [Opisthorchis felineus]